MATPNGNPFFMICDKTAVRDLIVPQRVLITIRDTTSLIDALNILTTAHITSCPVLDSSNQCVGSVDFLSLLKHTTLQSQRDDPINIETTPVKDVLQYCSTLVPYFIENPVSNLIDVFSIVHRVALYKKDYELITTLSQSDIIRYIIKIIDDMNKGESYTRRYATDIKQLIDMKLQDLKLFHTPQSLPSSSTMYEAIELCSANNFRVLSVVNEQGQIIGDFCVEKLSNLKDNYHRTKQITLLEWVTKLNAQASHEVPCIDSNATYQQAMQLMLSCHSHHLWVIDDNKKPILVCTMTDLLRALKTSDVDLSKISGDVELHKLWK